MQDKVARLHQANAILVEQVLEVEDSHATIEVNSLAMATCSGLYQDHHTTVLEACTSVVDAIFPMGESVVDRLGVVSARLPEVVRHVVQQGSMLALAAAYLQTGMDLHEMALGFLPGTT